MMGLYIESASVLHRAPASVKFLLLFLVLAGVFLVENPYALGGILLFSLLLYPFAGIRPPLAWAAVRPVVPFMVLTVAAQMLFNTLQHGAVFGIRMLVAVLLASLLTYTTRSGDMLDFFGKMLEPLRHVGISPWRASLVLSLTLRAVPLLSSSITMAREAFLARGQKAAGYEIVVPVIVGLIQTAEAIGDAISARGLESDLSETASLDETSK
ncbi:energy-coupling factor transporter transmembrane protein EcfT [Arthrobacter alkaliphilus]|uniref:energy-coupling factor transporter transmembrane component T family protein n=1 Tax=Arthrobacter alkaliphilus TaxID=369936 RepID=UPI001F2911F8|nr:CbiQ family ECF transporter T component [Arthrobacter alkaliphilus]